MNYSLYIIFFDLKQLVNNDFVSNSLNLSVNVLLLVYNGNIFVDISFSDSVSMCCGMAPWRAPPAPPSPS